MRYASPLLAVALTLAGGLVVFATLGKSPLEGFRVFFLSPLKDAYGVAELFFKATPLMLIAVGLAVGFRANVWNIGAEGQYIVGAIAGAGVALYFEGSASLLLLPSMVVGGAIGGALWASIAAVLKTRFNANEILVSLMLVYIAQLGVSWLVHGPWKDPDGFNFPQTRMFTIGVLPVLLEGTAQRRSCWLATLAAATRSSTAASGLPDAGRGTGRGGAPRGVSRRARVDGLYRGHRRHRRHERGRYRMGSSPSTFRTSTGSPRSSSRSSAA
jgi:ABC-type uncharacterized transport system permease subunit